MGRKKTAPVFPEQNRLFDEITRGLSVSVKPQQKEFHLTNGVAIGAEPVVNPYMMARKVDCRYVAMVPDEIGTLIDAFARIRPLHILLGALTEEPLHTFANSRHQEKR